MYIRLLIFCWFCVGPVCLTFGQQNNNEELYSAKHFVFWNISNYFDPSGNSLQFGYNYQCKPWMDLQLEVGFVSDDLLVTRLPFAEYLGFRIRPQIKFLNKKSLFNRKRWYGGIILSYQRLTFSDNKNFRIDDSFNQNISYQGKDQSFAWYIVTGKDTKLSNQLFFSFSFGLGQVFIKTKTNEGDIPPNANIINDCRLFCGRSESTNREINRPGILFDAKFGYRF